MKTRYINTIVGLLLALVFFLACSDDPSFPDPRFEVVDQRVEVRLDTADHYNIKMHMNVPNAVQKILLLDALDYRQLEQVDDYNGKKEFDFTYKVDFKSFASDKDTILNYIVKVVDKDQRNFNRGIRIAVKKKSVPEFLLPGGTKLAIAAPAYKVRGLVTTGLNAIESVKIRYKDEVIYTYTPPADTTIHEMGLRQPVLLGLPNEDDHYEPIFVEIEDNKGQKSTTGINLRKTSFDKKVERILHKRDNGNVNTMKFEYDEENRIKAFDYHLHSGGNKRHEFSYNEEGMVDTLKIFDINKEGIKDYLTNIYYHYQKGTKFLERVEEQLFEFEDGEMIDYGADEVVSNFVYDIEKSTVKSFYMSSSRVEDIKYFDPFGMNETVFGEYWQNDEITIPKKRQHRSEFEPVLMPTYMEVFPPFTFSGSMILYNDLFWHKYLMLSTVPSIEDDNELEKPSYTYETDKDGNLTKITKSYWRGEWWGGGKYVNESYTFEYQ